MFLRFASMGRRAYSAAAPAVTSNGVPRPLSIRMDSLLVQCMIAAAIYFVPQDAAMLGLGLVYARSQSRNINAPANLDDPKKSLNAFLASRGLEASQVEIKQGRTWQVKMNSMFK